MWRNTTVTVAILFAVTACAGDSGQETGNNESGSVDEVTVGVIPIVDVAPIYLGKEKGFFSERNIEPTMATGSGGAASVPGVTSGEFEFAFGNITSLLVARDQDLPLRAVANGVASTGEPGNDFGAVVVREDSPITDAADLEGAQVSVNNVNNIGDTTIRAAVRNAGGDPAAVKFTEVPFPDASAAVQNERVDAAWVVEPFVTSALSEGARVVTWNFAEAAEDLPIALYFTSEEMVENEPDLVKRFTAAINESLRYADEHPEEVRAILDEYAQIPDDIQQDMILPRFPVDINVGSIERIGELAHADGLLRNEPDVEGLLR